MSSTSNSPDRNWRANSLFSPTYELVVREIRFCINRMPRPQSSTPQLFETTRRSETPASTRADINSDGIPQSPNPPTAMLDPSLISATASAGVAITLLTTSDGSACSHWLDL